MKTPKIGRASGFKVINWDVHVQKKSIVFECAILSFQNYLVSPTLHVMIFLKTFTCPLSSLRFLI